MKLYRTSLEIGLMFLLTLFPCAALAQSGQVLSVTPPLFQLSVAPGDIWQSSVKVVNGNPYPLTVYAEVVNFAPQGEQGQGRFIPIIDDEEEQTLAAWIEIAEGPHVIPPERTSEIGFFVEVPKDAPPGGHFAAILVGTQPPQDDGALVVQTSQVVTSLFFMRIEGDVIESGNIREFRVEDRMLSAPEAEFVLRFENKGNVHLQPRGEIKITNMWGEERGVIPINYQSHFGNVLPESIREFRFSWKGGQSFSEIGRYTAVATLAYGDDGIKNVDSMTYFWVIPLKATLITLSSVILFILFILWAVRLYIRRMLALAGVNVESGTVPVRSDLHLASYPKVSAPLAIGALDFKQRLSMASRFSERVHALAGFVMSYRRFFIVLVVLLSGLLAGTLFISDALKEQRSYEVTIEHDEGNTVVDSEEILREKLRAEQHIPLSAAQHFSIEILNASGEAGVAAEAAVHLEAQGYSVERVETGDEVRKQSVILYAPDVSKEAVALSSSLGGILLSALPTSIKEGSTTPAVRIILGSDHIQNP